MTRSPAFPDRGSCCRNAFTLVEAIVSVLIVGTLLITALNAVGASRVGQTRLGDRRAAALLAQQLMTEVLAGAYEDPDGTPVFGPEADETARALYDDLDDFHGWSASPPQYRDGTVIPNRTDWQRSVTVDYVDPNDLLAPVGSDQGVKRINVTVVRNSITLASLVAIRTRARDDAEPTP